MSACQRSWLLFAALLLSACGGEVVIEGGLARADALAEAAGRDRSVPDAAERESEAGSPSDVALDTDPLPADAPRPEDASDAGSPEASAACGCSAGAWFIELELFGQSFRLTEPYTVQLHCLEDAPLIADNCAGALRLLGCAGVDRGPPCLYLGMQEGTFLLGHVVDVSGSVWSLADATFDAGLPVSGGRSGTYVASVLVDGAVLDARGSFTVCASPRPECSP